MACSLIQIVWCMILPPRPCLVILTIYLLVIGRRGKSQRSQGSKKSWREERHRAHPPGKPRSLLFLDPKLYFPPLQHQNPQQLSANLWAAVRARGCQFLGPAMQEEVSSTWPPFALISFPHIILPGYPPLQQGILRS